MTLIGSDPARRRLLGRAASLAVAVAPFGIAFGVLCAHAGFHPLAALVITSTATSASHIVLDARVPALLVAAVLLWLRAPFVVVVLAAAGHRRRRPRRVRGRTSAVRRRPDVGCNRRM